MKKKLDTKFPASRIKKIMQADEDVGKIALAVPVLVSKALELFLKDLCDRTYKITSEKGVKTVNSVHLKQCIHTFSVFDFLKETVSKVPSLGGTEAGGADDKASKRRKPADEADESDEELKKIKIPETVPRPSSGPSGSSTSRGRGRGRGRGRPRGSGRGGERDSSRLDRYEDDPGTPPQHDNDKKPLDLKLSEEEMPAVNNCTSGTVVRNFDLNLDLDENGEASTADIGTSTSSAGHVIKKDENQVRSLSDMEKMDKMVIDPLHLSLLDKRVDEEDEDYDNEEG